MRLRSLSLSGNEISHIHNLFVGLKNLQLLDISRNHVPYIWRGDLFGLTRSVKILTDGSNLLSISTSTFATSFLKEKKLTTKTTPMDCENFVERCEGEKEKKKENSAEEPDAEKLVLKPKEIVQIFNKDTRMKLCKSDIIVTTLALFPKEEEFVEGCVEVFDMYLMMYNVTRVDLRKQDVRDFKKNWYQLLFLPIFTLNLSWNNITEITKEVLNDLPAGLTEVYLVSNKIHRIRKEVIENDHLKSLSFQKNLIDEIEADAFGKTKLRSLSLADNQLKSLDFVSSPSPGHSDRIRREWKSHSVHS